MSPLEKAPTGNPTEGPKPDWRSPEMIATEANNEAVMIRYKINSILSSARENGWGRCVVFSHKITPDSRYLLFVKYDNTGKERDKIEALKNDPDLTLMFTADLEDQKLADELGNTIAQQGSNKKYEINKEGRLNLLNV